MSGKGKSGEVPITEEERALVEVAVARWNDYQTRLKPFEDQYMQMVQKTPGDHAKARGEAASAVTQAFDPVRRQAEQEAFASGAAPGSGRHVMGTGAVAADEAAVRGVGVGEAHGAVQAQHLQGLQNVVRLGQGQSDLAYAGLGQSAQHAAVDATNRAAMAGQRRASTNQFLGNLAGAGLAYHMHSPAPSSQPTGLSMAGWAAPGQPRWDRSMSPNPWR